MKVTRVRKLRLKNHKWQWIETSTTSGCVLKILLEDEDLHYLECQIKGWKQSEKIRKDLKMRRQERTPEWLRDEAIDFKGDIGKAKLLTKQLVSDRDAALRGRLGTVDKEIAEGTQEAINFLENIHPELKSH